MTDTNENIFEYDSLEINEDNEVMGSAYTFSFEGGYDVQVAVSSYTYERDGKIYMNHVPNVCVVSPDGTIISEPYAKDSKNPEVAIGNAKSAAEYVYNNPQNFIK